MLLIDTNILVRCSQGQAITRLRALQERVVRLATTDRNVDEFGRKLIEVFGLEEDQAWTEVMEILDSVEIVRTSDYDHKHEAARSRLGRGGQSDWPTLAAALAFDAEIWSDDRDFFGVGVPVWSTHNVRCAGTDG